MNRPRMKAPILIAIFLFLFGSIFCFVAGKLPTAESILDNGGEKLNAIVLDADSDRTCTVVQIDDEDSFYDGDIIEVSQYSSNTYEGSTTTVYYDGETLLLSGVSALPTIFNIVGRSIQAVGGLVFVFALIKLFIFIAKVGIAGLAVGSIANEVKQQEQFNNQFYGNPEGRTNPYGNQYDNQQYQNYQQPYDQQYQNQGYNQQAYNQQQYNQQYQNQQNYTQQNNGNYYNQ